MNEEEVIKQTTYVNMCFCGFVITVTPNPNMDHYNIINGLKKTKQYSDPEAKNLLSIYGDQKTFRETITTAWYSSTAKEEDFGPETKLIAVKVIRGFEKVRVFLGSNPEYIKNKSIDKYLSDVQAGVIDKSLCDIKLNMVYENRFRLSNYKDYLFHINNVPDLLLTKSCGVTIPDIKCVITKPDLSNINISYIDSFLSKGDSFGNNYFSYNRFKFKFNEKDLEILFDDKLGIYNFNLEKQPYLLPSLNNEKIELVECLFTPVLVVRNIETGRKVFFSKSNNVVINNEPIDHVEIEVFQHEKSSIKTVFPIIDRSNGDEELRFTNQVHRYDPGITAINGHNEELLVYSNLYSFIKDEVNIDHPGIDNNKFNTVSCLIAAKLILEYPNQMNKPTDVEKFSILIKNSVLLNGVFLHLERRGDN